MPSCRQIRRVPKTREGAACDKIRNQPQADDGDLFSPVLCLERGSGVSVRLLKLELLTKKKEGGSGGWGVLGVLHASGGGILLLFLGKEGSSSMGP